MYHLGVVTKSITGYPRKDNSSSNHHPGKAGGFRICEPLKAAMRVADATPVGTPLVTLCGPLYGIFIQKSP
jgi:hypothetical protein